MAQVLGPKLETIEENIEQTKLDQKTALSTMITFTESMTRSFEEMKNTNMMDCIECGSCAYTCPASVPLVMAFRSAKLQIRNAAAAAAKK